MPATVPYLPSTDSIELPLFETFSDAESYYRHPRTRDDALDRTRIAFVARLRHKRFGSEGYAIEELVAELGAAFLCAGRQSLHVSVE